MLNMDITTIDTIFMIIGGGLWASLFVFVFWTAYVTGKEPRNERNEIARAGDTQKIPTISVRSIPKKARA
jgi:hypothetical protein